MKGSTAILLDRARDGDIDARDKVWERLAKEIYAEARRRVTWRLSTDPDGGKELAHDAFFKIFFLQCECEDEDGNLKVVSIPRGKVAKFVPRKMVAKFVSPEKLAEISPKGTVAQCIPREKLAQFISGETLAKLDEMMGLPEFQSRGKFLAYLAETMKYLSMDLAKHNKTAKAGGNLKAVVPVEGEDPEAVFGTGNRIIFPQPSPEKIALSRAIDNLREDLREVVHLKYWNQMTDKEIGTAIGKKASEVQALWKQAKLQLEKELAGKGKSVAT